MAEVLRASADGRLSVGKYAREQILRTFEERSRRAQSIS